MESSGSVYLVLPRDCAQEEVLWRLPVIAGKNPQTTNQSNKPPQNHTPKNTQTEKPTNETWASSLEPVACVEHVEKLIYRIRKKQIVKSELNLGKKFPEYKMGTYDALCHKATVG